MNSLEILQVLFRREDGGRGEHKANFGGKSMEMSVAVIGAGNGGTAIAGYLASVGANVRLCDCFQSIWRASGPPEALT